MFIEIEFRKCDQAFDCFRHDVTPSDQELPIARSVGTVSVFQSPPATPVQALVSQSRTQDETFTTPHKNTAEIFRKTEPVEIKVYVPDSADQEQHARGKFDEILDDLVETEKNYVKSLGMIQV